VEGEEEEDREEEVAEVEENHWLKASRFMKSALTAMMMLLTMPKTLLWRQHLDLAAQSQNPLLSYP